MDSPVILTPREQEYLLHALESALHLSELHQLFLWAQGECQALLPHQVMVCMQFGPQDELLRIECLHAHPLDAATLAALCQREHGLAPQLVRAGPRVPLALALDDGAPLQAKWRQALVQAGFDNVLLHTSVPAAGGMSAFALFGMPARPGARQAHLLSLLLPYLHMAMLRLPAGAQRATGAPARVPAPARALSPREAEILGWVGQGKSNDEIGLILGISGLTVKNHLQRIYRILGVCNRTQAITRCNSLQLLAPARARLTPA